MLKTSQYLNKVCSRDCSRKAEHFAEKFQEISMVSNSGISKTLEERECKQEHMTQMKLDNISCRIQRCNDKNAEIEQKLMDEIRTKGYQVQDLKGEVSDLKAKLNVLEQERLATHVAISGIPAGSNLNCFFTELNNYLGIANDVKFVKMYFANMEDVPKNQRKSCVFVLKNTTMRNLLVKKAAEKGRINLGEVVSGYCGDDKMYFKKIIVGEMMTDYNAALLKEARRLVSIGRLNSAYFENGVVKAVSAMSKNLYEVKSFHDLDCNMEGPEDQIRTEEAIPCSGRVRKTSTRSVDCQTPTFYQNYFSDDSEEE